MPTLTSPTAAAPPACPTLSCPALLPGPGLAFTAYHRLAALFATSVPAHVPSHEQWDAIADLLRHLQATADGRVAGAVYVSPIPAGTAKSTSLQAFAGAMCDDPTYSGVGTLILCNRVTECHDMAAALAPWADKLRVIVSEKHPETIALGKQPEADKAQILVATQASLKATLRTTGSFAKADRYHYLGSRRAVVCWDEAISFARPVALDGFVLAGLAKAMSRQSPQAAATLLQWSGTVALMDEGVCEVPDFAQLGVDLHELEDAVADNDGLAAEAKALTVISGGTAYVKRDAPKSAAVVKAIPELPESLLPVTVTDASAARGVHHASYEQMASRRPVVYLKEASKTYRNLTLRIIPTRASRSAYRDKTSTRGLELVEMAVRYIRSVAPDDVLVVTYKGFMAMKGVKETAIGAAIGSRLTDEERARVRYLAYGNHTATNEHRHVRRVMLMGLNFTPRYASYAASGAALEKPMDTDDPADHPSERQVEDMRIGMLRDSTLQAILRGHARMGVNGDCGEMEAVVPQLRQTGLSDADWDGMFPGANRYEDHSLLPKVTLKGRPKAAAEAVMSLRGLGLGVIQLPLVREHIGIDAPAFSKLLKRPDWKAWVNAQGLCQVVLPGKVLALRAP